MLKSIFFLLIFVSLKCLSTPGISDLTLYQIALNTLNSVRELNQIATDQREFSENFERIYSKIDQGVWKADRVAMWLDDMKSLGEMEVNDLNDFNYVLSSLKDETSFLKTQLVKIERQKKQTEKIKNDSEIDQKRSKDRIGKYSSETKGALSPNQAQVETAKNTKDNLIEMARLNNKIDKLAGEFSKLVILEQERASSITKKELIEREKFGQLQKGILSNEELGQ